MLNDTNLILAGNLNITNAIKLNNNYIFVPRPYQATIENISLPPTSTLFKEDEGILSLPATNQLDCSLQINKGTLILTDTVINRSVAIENNTKLKGSAHILTDLINKGVLILNDASNIINIDGQYIQEKQGELHITIAPSSNPKAGVDYDQLSVNGTANITDSNIIINAEAGEYINGTKYAFLRAASGVIGTFGNYKVNITSPYQGQLIYNSNDVTLIILDQALPVAVAHVLESNSDIARYINSLTVLSDDFTESIENLYNMSHDQLEDNLRSLAPNRNLVAAYLNQDLVHLVHNINHIRLEDNSGQPMYKTENSLNFTANKKHELSSKANLMRKINTYLDHNLINSNQHYIWRTPFVQLANQDNINRKYGYEAKTTGMAFGYDYKLEDNGVMGLSMGYYRTNFDYHNQLGANNKINAVFLSFYGGKKIGNGYINASLLGSYHKNNLQKYIHIEPDHYKAVSKHKSHIISPRLEFGYKVEECCANFIPFIATEYLSSFNQSYNEKEAGPLNMHINSGRNDLLINELGIKLK